MRKSAKRKRIMKKQKKRDMPIPVLQLGKSGRLFHDGKSSNSNPLVLKMENSRLVSLVAVAFSRPVLAAKDNSLSIILLACIDQLGCIYKLGFLL